MPVAARVLMGLLMVPAFFTLILLTTSIIWGMRERQRSDALLTAVDTTGRPLSSEWRDAIDRMQELERSRLVRVIGVGLTVEAAEISVEFLAVEVREVGGVVTVRASGAPVMHSSRAARPASPNLSVSDDVGTRYIVVPGGGGGGEGSMQYDMRFMPSPPAAATRLTLSINDFSPSNWLFDRPATSDPDPGVAPWKVSVEL